MKIGRYKRRLTFQRLPVARSNLDGLGQPKDAWEDVCTVWGYVAPLRARDFYAAQQAQSEIAMEIGVRYMRGITTLIKPDMRAVDGADIYEISAVMPDEKRREIILPCKAVTR